MPKTGNFRVDYLWAVERGCEREGLWNWVLVTGIEEIWVIYSHLRPPIRFQRRLPWSTNCTTGIPLSGSERRGETCRDESDTRHGMTMMHMTAGLWRISATPYRRHDYFMAVSSPSSSSFVRKVVGCSFPWLTTVILLWPNDWQQIGRAKVFYCFRGEGFWGFLSYKIIYRSHYIQSM